MKKYILSLIFLVIVIVGGYLLFTNNNSSENGQFITYSNPSIGFKIDYPGGFNVQEITQNKYVKFSGNRGDIIVSIQPIVFNPNDSKYTKSNLEFQNKTTVNQNEVYQYVSATAFCTSEVNYIGIKSNTIEISFKSCKENPDPIYGDGRLQDKIIGSFAMLE